MASAPTVIGRGGITRSVIVIKDEVFALIPDDIGHTIKVTSMLRDDESARLVRYDHTGRIHIAALVVYTACVLVNRYLNVR
jgi:hypothetical protein